MKMKPLNAKHVSFTSFVRLNGKMLRHVNASDWGKAADTARALCEMRPNLYAPPSAHTLDVEEYAGLESGFSALHLRSLANQHEEQILT